MKRSIFLFLLALGAVHAAETPPAVSVETLTTQIIRGHPELKFYQAEIAAAQAAGRAKTALSDPELSLDLGRKRVRDATGAAAGEGAAWSISVTQTFEWPGRMALRKAIAGHQVQLAQLGLARFEQALGARTRTLAFGLFAAQAKADAVREVADRFTALKETFLAREPAGITPQLETRVIESAELGLQRRATQAQLEVQAALIELNLLRGAAPDAPLRVATPAMTFADAPSTEALFTGARENNFEYRMRRLEVEQQGYEVRLARNERYPGVTVGPYVSQEKAGDKETTVGLSLSVPLPVTGRGAAGVDLAEARRRQAETAVLLAQRDLDRDVLTSAQTYATKVAAMRGWSADAVQKFRDAAELADRHYRLGAVPIATYVELQKSYLEAVEAILETQKESIEAGLRLQQLTGLNLNLIQISP